MLNPHLPNHPPHPPRTDVCMLVLLSCALFSTKAALVSPSPNPLVWKAASRPRRRQPPSPSPPLVANPLRSPSTPRAPRRPRMPRKKLKSCVAPGVADAEQAVTCCPLPPFSLPITERGGFEAEGEAGRSGGGCEGWQRGHRPRCAGGDCKGGAGHHVHHDRRPQTTQIPHATLPRAGRPVRGPCPRVRWVYDIESLLWRLPARAPARLCGDMPA